MRRALACIRARKYFYSADAPSSVQTHTNRRNRMVEKRGTEIYGSFAAYLAVKDKAWNVGTVANCTSRKEFISDVKYLLRCSLPKISSSKKVYGFLRTVWYFLSILSIPLSYSSYHSLTLSLSLLHFTFTHFYFTLYR